VSKSSLRNEPLFSPKCLQSRSSRLLIHLKGIFRLPLLEEGKLNGVCVYMCVCVCMCVYVRDRERKESESACVWERLRRWYNVCVREKENCVSVCVCVWECVCKRERDKCVCEWLCMQNANEDCILIGPQKYRRQTSLDLLWSIGSDKKSESQPTASKNRKTFPRTLKRLEQKFRFFAKKKNNFFTSVLFFNLQISEGEVKCLLGVFEIHYFIFLICP